MKKVFSVVTIGAVLSIVAGCASGPDAQDDGIPDWVNSPSVEDGLATASCVPSTGRFNIDRNQATTDARGQLAATMNAQIQAMAEDYMRTSDLGDDGEGEPDQETGGQFESVTRQVVDEDLSGAGIIEQGYTEMGGTKQFCVLVSVGQRSINEALQRIAEASEINDPEVFSEAERRERYLSQDAIGRMEEQLED